MVLSKPPDDVVSQPYRELSHRLRIRVGHKPDAFVTGDVPLLSERIERVDQRDLGADRLAERLDHPIVMLIPRRSVSGRGESGSRRLQCSVVGDIQLPVRAQPFSGAVREVALDDCEQVEDFGRAGPVRDQPSVPLPVR